MMLQIIEWMYFLKKPQEINNMSCNVKNQNNILIQVEPIKH